MPDTTQSGGVMTEVAPTGYDPLNPVPYRAPRGVDELSAPPITAPPPRRIEDTQQPPSPRLIPGGKGTTAATIATLGSSILRGYMRGKEHADQIKAFKTQRLMTGLETAYRTAAQKYIEMAKAGADPNSKEMQEAAAAADASWQAMMTMYGNYIEGDGKGKGKGKKKGQAQAQGGAGGDQPNPISVLIDQTASPEDRTQAYYQITMRAGPSYKHLAAPYLTPEYRKQIELQRGEQRITGDVQAKRIELHDLQNKDPKTLDEKQRSRLEQLQTDPELFPEVSRVTPHYGTSDIPGTSLATAKDAYGNPVKDKFGNAIDPKLSYRTETIGGVQTYVPSTGGGLGKARPMVGKPITGKDLPQGAQDINGNALQGNPSENYYPLFYANGQTRWLPMQAAKQLKVTAQPGTGLPEQIVFDPIQGTFSGPPIGMGVAKVQTTDAQGNPVTEYVLTDKVPVTTGGGRGRERKTGQPAGQPAEQPKPSGAGAGAGAGAGTPPASPTAGASFPRYSKDVQGRYMAIRGQELTLNGIPGSTTDIGLRQATLNAMGNQATAKKIAVAMQALDQHAKTNLANRQEGDYGYVKYLQESWYSIPALQKAFGALNADPAGKVYLDNFFRAWTNAATIRALQGTTGRPTQSMYAMLVNELPMIGVNVANKTDATRKLDMLQHDVDIAKETLPEHMKENIRKGFKTTTANTPIQKLATHQHIRDYAKAKNITESAAEKEFTDAGYTIQ